MNEGLIKTCSGNKVFGKPGEQVGHHIWFVWFETRISLYCLDWPGIHYKAQADLELKDILFKC